MLPLILLAASLLPSQQISAQCVDTGANIAATQTQAVRGPSGAVAVLKVSTSDDYGKNSHLCNAVYQLLFTPAPGGAQVVTDLLAADDDYGRTLTLRLNGFSQDGKRVLGIFSERSKKTIIFLFEYDTASGGVQLYELTKQFAHIVAPSCGQTFDAVATSETGAIILELDSANSCPSNGRWILNRAASKPVRLPQGASILSLYESKSGGQ